MKLWALIVGAILIIMSLPFLWWQITGDINSAFINIGSSEFNGAFFNIPALIIGIGLIIYGFKS